MLNSVHPSILKRYADIARLLMKYGRADLVTQSGLDQLLAAGDPLVAPTNDSASPEDLADDLEQLGPTFIKLGQLLSTRADLLPPEYLQALARLQDHVEPISWEVVEKQLKDELDGQYPQAFASFDKEPLATASLAQVHRAVLRDGTSCAIKVQRPGIEEEVKRDLQALFQAAKTLDHHTSVGKQFQFHRIIESLRETLLRELDYAQEAQNCELLADALSDFDEIVIPRAFTEVSSRRVLTLEFLAGVKITDLDDATLEKLDRSELARQLFNCYLDQVLVIGLFHADPHPGNILLTRDSQIALIDLGMVVRVPDAMQRLLLKLLLAISEGHADETARVAERMSEENDDYDQDVFRHKIAKLVAEHHAKPVEKLEAGRIVMQIQAVAGQCGVVLPEELTLLGKTLMNLDRTLSKLDPKFNPNQAMQRRARRLLERQTRQRLTLGSLYQSMMEGSEFALMLPERMNKIMELVSDNKIKVTVDAVDETELLKGIQKIANRITTGIILASIIVGASLMMQLETSLTIFGYPAIAVIFFVVAASVGLSLVYQTLKKDIV